MTSRKKRLQSFKLYAVTDLHTYDESYLKKIESVLVGGADIIQLRSKRLTDRQFFTLGVKIKKIAQNFNTLFFVNDRPDMCIALDADGIHIGQDDLPVDVVRRLIPRGRLIGKSTHSLEQAVRTMQEDVDYIGFGPIYGTPTKPDYHPVGLQDIKKVIERATVPVVCIGGIDKTTIRDVVHAGAQRIAVVRAVFAQEDVEQAARDLKMFLTEKT
ncbi:MAG: thiamine phosphate synthase [Candidatus Omnitrophica bacterium]|nr:thiamine phosphate synthase [Candidatus Omnitrophota bacterium]